MTVRTEKVRLVRALRVFFIGAVALFAGCGGNTNITYGTAVLSVKGTGGSFISYQVAIDSITLTRNDGIVVAALQSPQTVDFTRVTDIAELVGSPAIPAGTYLSASVVLDYTTSSIWVDESGQAVQASPVTSGGVAMAQAVITVTFDTNDPLIINAQQSTRLALDVNLAAFNTATTTTTPPVVLVQPFVNVSTATLDSTPMRARGLYVTQVGVASGFIVNARPFVDQISALGAETINTTAQTYFNVNGTVYTGAAGLAALTQQPQNTLIVAYGTLGDLSGVTPTFNATQVYAGLIVQTPLADQISGVVSARSGDTVTIHGGAYFTVFDQMQFFNSATITLGSGTTVIADGSTAGGLTVSAVSVGQHVTIFGQGAVSGLGTTASPLVLTMDATQGLVRLHSTRLWGTLSSAVAGSATLNMLSLQNFEPAAFNFAGTGTAGQDASPTAYVVNTGTTDESGTAAGTLLRVDGLVSAFGAAPPDFTATTITPGSATTDQELVVTWTATGSGTVKPFTSNTAAGLVVDLANANLTATHYISTGPSKLNLTALPASPLITTVGVPAASLQLAIGLPLAAVAAGTDTTVTQTNSAATLASAITTAFTGSTPSPIYSLVAVGQYNGATNTFTASKININLY
jgi:hypothetical protein